MNKLVSVKQNKKNVEFYDVEDEFVEGEIEVESIFNNILNKSESKQSLLVENSCENENCIAVYKEIIKLKEECLSLENKCILIDYVKSEQLFEVSEKISELCHSINKMINIIETHEGELLDNLNYENLTKIEFNLMKLLVKVRSRISKVIKIIK